MKNLKYDAVIFDFDGTLVDSMSIWEDIDRKFCERQGIDLPAGYLESITALSYIETAEYLRDSFNIDMGLDEMIEHFNEIAMEQYQTSVECKSGAPEFLEALKRKGTKITIATSLCSELLEAGLKGTGLEEYFGEVFHCDEYDTNKLESKIYKVASESLQVAPQKCLVFEDILPAIKSAKSIGMTAIGVYDTHMQQDSDELRRHADYFIESFLEVPF